MRSKQSNGYDDVFMQACRTELTITPDIIRQGDYWIAESDNVCGVVGFAVDESGQSGEVHTFFVDPDKKRKGIGKQLWQKIVERANNSGIYNLHVDADPEAVPFYRSLGFEITGETPSGSIEGRSLPYMELQLPSLES